MKPSQLTILYFSLVESYISAWEHTNADDFRRAISGHNHALVAFVEPSTATCQTLESEWLPIAESEKTLISIDCTSEAALCSEFDIISYPTLRFFDGHGGMRSYRGPRKASAITAFLKRAVRPAVSKLSEKKLATFPTVDDIVFIAHLNPEDEHIKHGYKTIASQYQDRASFGAVETKSSTNVVCYNNKDGQQSKISDLAAIDALPNFVQACMEPLIGEFTRANEMKYLQAGKSLVFFFAATSKDREAFVDTIRPVAKMYQEYLNFVTVDANEYADLAAPLGIRPGRFPALSVQNPMFGQVFPYPPGAKITAENVGRFVMDIVQGKVKPWDGQFADDESDQAHDEL
ncbi:ER-resident thioredoxin [Biscogniauxia mediterranea]|nr:ER-resident thioredoxin [Biscogniauxia mediterranea]